jgi:hypothetical protein
MRLRIQFAVMLLFIFIFFLCKVGMGAKDDDKSEPYNYFREYVGLNAEQIQSITNGKALAKVLDAGSADQILVFGAVHIDSTPEKYLKFASDIDALRKLPSYLEIRKFNDPPVLSDLDGFTLEEGDVKQLKDCRPGRCEIQLPAESMEEFQKSVNWSAPDVADQANRLARQMALDALLQYQKGGNAALGTYRDKNHPAAVAETFESLLSRLKALPVYLPDLNNYLLQYPSAPSANIQSQFYWEKVKFGLKPTLRMVQAIIYRGTVLTKPAYAVAIKQLYSSHYFEAALDLTVCLNDSGNPDRPGFFLITLKSSQQAGLTGLKGGIVRKVAVDKTRSSLERALASIKQKLETPTG